jgi:uncharacterized protein involved in response to NO
MSIPRTRPYDGPALLSYGFRPFFLFGALYAGLSILFWLPLFEGRLEIWSAFHPVDWHVHEMLFGFLAAVITGFLLTAVPNWTGSLPVQGTPLLVLFVIWLAGRIAITLSAVIGPLPAALVDCAFLAAVVLIAGREITAGRNWRNIKVLLPVAVLLAANIFFHWEAWSEGSSDVSRRLGMSAAIVLIMLIGGRVIPSFTRNWLVRENPGRLPTPFDRFDIVVIAVSTAALAAWTGEPDWGGTGIALGVAGVLNIFRLLRWAGDRTLRDPLVLILHLAYAFVPAGFILSGLAALAPEWVTSAAGIHSFGTGAVGAMTLSVMVRATLGHTGRALHAGRAACFVFAAIVLAALIRILASFELFPDAHLVHLAGLAWAAAFLGFALAYARALLTASSPKS